MFFCMINIKQTKSIYLLNKTLHFRKEIIFKNKVAAMFTHPTTSALPSDCQQTVATISRTEEMRKKILSCHKTIRIATLLIKQRR